MSRLDAEDLAKLRELTRHVKITEAERAVAAAHLDAFLARSYEVHDRVQGIDLVCLVCGYFFRQGQPCGCAPASA